MCDGIEHPVFCGSTAVFQPPNKSQSDPCIQCLPTSNLATFQNPMVQVSSKQEGARCVTELSFKTVKERHRGDTGHENKHGHETKQHERENRGSEFMYREGTEGERRRETGDGRRERGDGRNGGGVGQIGQSTRTMDRRARASGRARQKRDTESRNKTEGEAKGGPHRERNGDTKKERNTTEGGARQQKDEKRQAQQAGCVARKRQNRTKNETRKEKRREEGKEKEKHTDKTRERAKSEA